MSRESAGQTLQATALVHEAWLRLVKDTDRDWQNRSYFFAAAAEAMRRILVENARRKSRVKHGGGHQRISLEDFEPADTVPDDKLLLVNEAIEEMEREDPQMAKVVLLKYFSSLTNKEVAEAMGISVSSVDRLWFSARRWLFKKLNASL
jgi:RNA polymerase sigma factor (TIGR02999 family)